MQAFDPTSVPQSIPAPPGDAWSVDEVATIQASLVAGADSTAADGPALTGPAQRVSGRYRSAGAVELELRVDIDGERPTRRVSGDFFRRTGATMAYAGSFVVNTPRITPGAREVVVEGEGVFSFASGSPVLRLTIPRAPATAARAPIEARFLTTSGIPGALHHCQFQSPAFRTIEWEQDVVASVTPFSAYDTSGLPAPGRARKLSVAAAFGEAGIEVIDTGGANALPLQLAGADRKWTNSELHFAMTRHFSKRTVEPAWRVYLLAATAHEDPRVRGIMFDSDKRQGCAVFHDAVGSGGTGNPATLRAMLRTYVHELGHCFNLYHSHMKDLMHPPAPNRLDALSWMHYPDNFVGASGSGAAAYWRAFPFQFDDDELVHLRHGFRDAVVPGGKAFGLGAADVDPAIFAEPIADESGLALEIRGPGQYLLGTPVVVEFKLSLTDMRGRTVNASIHPNHGFTQLGIARSGSSTVVYRPMITQCADPELVHLGKDSTAIYASAYVGYGKDGFYFDSPGTYELRAMHSTPEGSRIMSNVLTIRVKAPMDRGEDKLADLFIGDEQGQLFYLLGSDSEGLDRGRNALRTAIDEHGDHPLASYARLIEGMNASRAFKKLDGAKSTERPVDAATAEAMLDGAVSATYAAPGAKPDRAGQPDLVPRLDNISLDMAVTRLAEVRGRDGDIEAATATAETLHDYLEATGVNAKVRADVRDRMDAVVAAIEAACPADDAKPAGVRKRPAKGATAAA